MIPLNQFIILDFKLLFDFKIVLQETVLLFE
jgi:hypothetical protein